MRVLLAYSGGLDTSYLVARLRRHGGHEVTTLTVDCGGFDEAARGEIEARALALGAHQHLLVDARVELFERVLRWLIAGNVRRGGVYPLSVGAERGVQAEVLARLAREGGFDAVAHGCTAAGNDQVRFEAALRTVAPGLPVLAPIRDEAPARREQVDWLRAQGLPLPPHGGAYSVNAGLWGLTIGGAEMLGSSRGLPETAWQWTRGSSPGARWSATVRFERGVPVALDGVVLAPVALIETLNAAAGAAGVGRGYHLGDTVLGIKGRIAFEAPAAEVLLTAHRELEKLVLTEDQRLFKDQLAEHYGRRLHQGLFHEPFLRDVEALLASSQARVTGQVSLAAFGSLLLPESVLSPYSLLAASDARYGERAASDADPAGAAGLAKILSQPARLYAAAAPSCAPDAPAAPGAQEGA